MPELREMKCVACRADAPTIDAADRALLKPQIPAWEIVREEGVERLRRKFSFGTFAEALDFTNQVAAVAEEEGHHPAILLEWGRATVSWWTHKIGGLHVNDFILAARTDDLWAARDGGD